MNARFVGRPVRWTHLASISACVLAGACAEPTTVDPKLVPEASIDVGPEAPSDADPDAPADASTGGSGGSGGTGGTGGSGGTGGITADADVRSETSDGGDARDEVADASQETATDAPVVDTTIPPESAADVRDTSSDPSSEDSGGRDGVADAPGDRG